MRTSKTERHYIEIEEIETGKVVKRLDVTGRGDRVVERICNGIFRQMDQEKFSVYFVFTFDERPTGDFE